MSVDLAASLRALERLVTPHPALVEPERRRQARLLATLMLGLMACFAGLDTALVVTQPQYVPPWYGYVALLTAYGLARSRLFVVGAYLVVLMFPVVAFVILTRGETPAPSMTFGYLVLAILMGTIVLNRRGVVVVTIVNVAVIVAAGFLSPERLAEADILGPISVNVLAALLAIVYMSHRDAVEADRRRELLAAQAQMRRAQKMDAVGRLAATVAHDFNNMLTVVGGNLDLLQRTGGTEGLDDAQEAVSAASDLVGRLLTVGRAGLRKVRPHPVAALLGEAEAMIRRLVTHPVVFQVETPAPELVVEIDAGQLRLVLINLAVNARDAMPDGGRLTISATAIMVSPQEASQQGVAPGAYVAIDVGDEGEGMDEATQERIFEPFFTTKDPGQGTGLGLAMVFGAVRQSGGFVVVESRTGRGTRMRVMLPRANATSSPTPGG